jgi:hypothetical protein
MFTKDPGSRRSLIYGYDTERGHIILRVLIRQYHITTSTEKGNKHMNPKDLERRPRPTEWRSTLAL